MTHTSLVAVHAASATLALALGLVAISRGRLFPGYLASLAAMELSLLGAVVVGWQRSPPVANLVFTGLLVLGAVMWWRGGLAWRLLRSGERPSPACVSHVGFTLVSLVDAFVVVSVLRAGAPIPIVVAAGVAIGVGGHVVLTAVPARLTRETPSRQHPRSRHHPSGSPGEWTVMPRDSAPRAWTRSWVRKSS